jgi:predicted component of type VI protein secretion system
VGTKLKLTPANPDAILGIHLVARPIFKIGRSRLDADYVAWFWPRSHSNDERTRHLSRVHVFAEIHDGKFCLRDGGSVGGSNFDGQPLASEKWEPIARRATLVMSGEYFLDVQPAASAYPGEPVIKNIKLWNGPPESQVPPVAGAVHFSPINTEPAHHLAVWLFTDASFGSSRQNPVALEDQGLAEIQGRFHHYHGAFWLENCSKNDAVRVNYYNLKPNEIAPLINGQLVQIGRINYHVEVVA